MFHAKAAAMQSADLSRQVGAVIADNEMRIIATGCNDVPKAGGGIYWATDSGDTRDFQLGHDSNARFKDETLVEILGRLKDSPQIGSNMDKALIQGMIDDVMRKGSSGIFEGARVTNVIEFGRIVHAEMAAITQAARYGASVRGAYLYCTTFPCHMCARHVIAAGISKVVYIEPYPKSLAKDLYADSISIDPNVSPEEIKTCLAKIVYFVPFEGAAPRRFSDFFSRSKRKDKLGNAITWNKRSATIALASLISAYTSSEAYAINVLDEIMAAKGLDKPAVITANGGIEDAGQDGVAQGADQDGDSTGGVAAGTASGSLHGGSSREDAEP